MALSLTSHSRSGCSLGLEPVSSPPCHWAPSPSALGSLQRGPFLQEAAPDCRIATASRHPQLFSVCQLGCWALQEFLGTGTMSRCIHPWPSRRAHAPGPLVTAQRTCGGCEPWGRVKARLDAFWGALCVCPGRTVWGVIPWLWCVLAGGLRASQRTPWSSHVLLCKLETQAAALHVVGGVSNCVGCRAQCGHVLRPTWWPFSSLWFRREHRGLVVRRNQTLHGARGLVEEGPEPCVALSGEGRSEMSSYFTPLLYG